MMSKGGGINVTTYIPRFVLFVTGVTGSCQNGRTDGRVVSALAPTMNRGSGKPPRTGSARNGIRLLGKRVESPASWGISTDWMVVMLFSVPTVIQRAVVATSSYM